MGGGGYQKFIDTFWVMSQKWILFVRCKISSKENVYKWLIFSFTNNKKNSVTKGEQKVNTSEVAKWIISQHSFTRLFHCEDRCSHQILCRLVYKQFHLVFLTTVPKEEKNLSSTRLISWVKDGFEWHRLNLEIFVKLLSRILSMCHNYCQRCLKYSHSVLK